MHSRIRPLHPNVDTRRSLRGSRSNEAVPRKDPEGLAERHLELRPCDGSIDTES